MMHISLDNKLNIFLTCSSVTLVPLYFYIIIENMLCSFGTPMSTRIYKF